MGALVPVLFKDFTIGKRAGGFWRQKALGSGASKSLELLVPRCGFVTHAQTTCERKQRRKTTERLTPSYPFTDPTDAAAPIWVLMRKLPHDTGGGGE
jgi:hypothetical protein